MSKNRLVRTVMAGGLTTAALAGCGGSGNHETLTQQYEAGVACKGDEKPFIPSTDAEAGRDWADVDIACTDGSDTTRPIAVTEGVKQGILDGYVTVTVKGGDDVQVDVEDSNIRTSSDPHGEDVEMTVRKLAFDNIDVLGSITVTPQPVPIKQPIQG